MNLPEGWKESEEVKALVQQSVKEALASEVDGLRANRDAILEEKKALAERLQQYKLLGEDPDTLKQKLAQLDDAEKSNLRKDGKTEELVKLEVERATKQYAMDLEERDARLKAMEAALEGRNGALSQLQLENGIQAGLNEAGLTPQQGALKDLVVRGREVWRFDPESMQTLPYGPDGQVLRGADHKPITYADWAKSVAKDAGYLFASQAKPGTGATGGSGGGEMKLWKDMTIKEQTQLYQQNPEQAKALMGDAR